ncbi:metallophosphoesterase [Plantactinospora sp. KBS50]|uniref:metallophosphoesterase family protein n=1 Tax=Plantactinospora sp. KBS50 TaxID=2024580 RepID=UPI000BAB0BE5|nr:metallophosphoesterase [Plantactinospora sp. KBS50]
MMDRYDDNDAPETRQRRAVSGARAALATARRWGTVAADGLTAASLGTRRAAASTWGRRTRIALATTVVSLLGVLLGVLLGGRVETDIGPFRAQLALSPSVSGGTTVRIPPLGALQFDSHDGPARLTVQLGALDQRRTEALISDPGNLDRISKLAVHDVSEGAARLVLRTVGAALLSSLLLAALVFRNVRRVAWSGVLSLAITGGSLGLAGLTMHPRALEEPRYEGLLVNAPAVIGDARSIATNYGKYAQQLQRLVGNVSKLYTTLSALPVYEPSPGTTRVLHISDLHLNPSAFQVIQTVVEQFDIDVVIDTGDITDWGSEPEASFVNSIGQLKKPYVYIRGNHDSSDTAAEVAKQPNAIVLDQSITRVAGLTIAGAGDPRFTPDKETSPAGSGLTATVADQVITTGERLADTIRMAAPQKVDIALVHDPASAGPLSGTVPLVLAGHVHHREVLKLPQVPDEQSTQLFVEGSTGGAGLRGLEGEKPTPLSMTVLYFDPGQKLQAYDEITVGGTGQAQVNLERHIITDPKEGDPRASVTPTPTRGPSPTPSAPTGSASPTNPSSTPGSPVPTTG